jgi:hypothetical protein
MGSPPPIPPVDGFDDAQSLSLAWFASAGGSVGFAVGSWNETVPVASVITCVIFRSSLTVATCPTASLVADRQRPGLVASCSP